MAERKTRGITLEDIREAINGYPYVTIYRDTRQRNFVDDPIAGELMQASSKILGCYRVYMVGNRTALFVGSKSMDYATIRDALTRTSFTCHPIGSTENNPGSVMEKIVSLYGLDL